LFPFSSHGSTDGCLSAYHTTSPPFRRNDIHHKDKWSTPTRKRITVLCPLKTKQITRSAALFPSRCSNLPIFYPLQVNVADILRTNATSDSLLLITNDSQKWSAPMLGRAPNLSKLSHAPGRGANSILRLLSGKKTLRVKIRRPLPVMSRQWTLKPSNHSKLPGRQYQTRGLCWI